MPNDSVAPSDKLEKSSGNMDDIEAPKDSVAPSNRTEKARDYLDDKEAPTDSVSPSDKTEKSRDDLWHQVIKYTKQILQVTLIKPVIILIELKNLPIHIRVPIYQLLLVNYKHQYHIKYCWYPKCQMVFLF